MPAVERFGPEPVGATPLTEDDYRDLIPKFLPDRAALNFAEASNILKAQTKYLEKRVAADVVLDDLFVRKLHAEMFAEVWNWAGKYRNRNLNLGVDFTRVAESVRMLMQNSKLWLDDSAFEADFVACQLHHQLVLIHPFVNGNGRLSRLLSDVLLTSLGVEPFSWGAKAFSDGLSARSEYLEALRAADRGSLERLLQFARN